MERGSQGTYPISMTVTQPETEIVVADGKSAGNVIATIPLGGTTIMSKSVGSCG